MESTPPGELYRDQMERTPKERRPPPAGAAQSPDPTRPQQAREDRDATRTTTTGRQNDAYQPPRAMGATVGFPHPRQGMIHVCAQRQHDPAQPRGGKTTADTWRPNNPLGHHVDSAQRIDGIPQRHARRDPGGVDGDGPQGHHRQPALRCTTPANPSATHACHTGHAQENQTRDATTPKGLPGETLQREAIFPTSAAGRGHPTPRDPSASHRRAASAAGHEGTGDCIVEPLRLLHSARGRSAYNTV